MRGARRLAPVDPRCLVAGLIAPVLPEGLADTDAAAPVHPLGNDRGDPLGGHQQGRQRRRELFRLLTARHLAFRHGARSGERRAQPLDHLIDGDAVRRARRS